jgi:programmed cell death 6-interacting protein
VESIPSSTILPNRHTPMGFVQTQTHTRALRVLLESLDDLKRSLSQLVERAQRLAAADDIRPRIAKLAAGLERLAELKPIMFEDACDEELGKYDKFIQGIAENEQKLDDLLAAIRVRNFSALFVVLKFDLCWCRPAMSCSYSREGTTHR